jgi:hypothetical protein
VGSGALRQLERKGGVFQRWYGKITQSGQMYLCRDNAAINTNSPMVRQGKCWLKCLVGVSPEPPLITSVFI